MHLSKVYERDEWGIVYHVSPDSDAVEMVKEVFFTSEADAWAWFHKHYNAFEFIEVEVVKFKGFTSLELERPGSKQREYF